MRKVSVAALGLLVCSTTAHADDVTGTRFDLRERAHEITVRVDRGTATLVVRRTVRNLGPKSDQALFSLHVPEAAVATRLRTQGTGNSWFEGELMDAEVAAAKYQELTGIGGYYPKDPALLSWRHRGELKLQVFPVAAQSDKTVEYTLQMPMRYADGAYRLELPVLGTDSMPARVRVVAGTPGDTLRVNGLRTSGAQVFERKPARDDEPTRTLDIELEPHAAATVAVRVADVRVTEGRRLLHASFDAAPKLGAVPSHAALAVVLDTSKSMEADLPAAVASIRAYLSHFSTGTVTVFTFDRTVHTPFGGARPVADTLASLHAWTPALGNGSALDAAITEADKTLAASGATARRMMVVTDLRMRTSLTAKRLAALDLKSGAIVHVAEVKAGAAENVRNDDDEWAGLPRKTGGLLWNAKTDESDPAARRVFEEWARPMRLDHLRVLGLAEYGDDETTLPEGEAIEHLVLASGASPSVRVEGQLWSRAFVQTARPDAAEERRWSALVFGTDLSDSLSEPEQTLLAMKGKAVSPMTSYLAIEPGVRPSTEGLEESEMSMGTGFGMAHGDAGSVFSAASRARSFDGKGFLTTRLTAEWKRCGGKGHATIELQSTLNEVVDVPRAHVVTADQSKQSCLREATWSLDLPHDFDEEDAFWDVEVDG